MRARLSLILLAPFQLLLARCFRESRQLVQSAVRARNYAQIVGTALAAAIFLSGCPASKKPSKLETMLANMAKDVAIPIEADNVKNPIPASDAVVQDGQHGFVLSCAICHGTDGHARASLGLAMYPPAMDLTSPHVQHWSDAQLFWIIQNGVRLTGMPAWKTMISENDSWKLVQFIRALPKLDQAAAAQQAAASTAPSSEAEWIAYGRKLYRQEGCFMCHQLEGEGGKVGPDLTIEDTRGRTNEWLIGHFKDPPAYTQGSLMPPFKNLTDQQLQALVAFLQSQKGPQR